MPKVTIYEDFVRTLTAYQASSNSKYDVTVDMSAADWANYNKVEGEYINWQSKLETLVQQGKRHVPRTNHHRIKAKAG